MESSCHSQSGDHENIVRCDEMYVSHDEVGFRLAGYWVLGTGYWVLGTGYWVLAIAPDSALQSHDVADAVERGDVTRVAIDHLAVDGDEIAAADLVHLSPRVQRDAAAVQVFLVNR